MKFESKFGIGEICIYGKPGGRKDRGDMLHDTLAEIIGIFFESDGHVRYHMEVRTVSKISHFFANEKDLIGDPDFDQETCYTDDD